MSAAITAGLIVAGGAAYAANKGAKAQQDAAKAGNRSNQTGSQNPYNADWYQGDLNSVLQYQRGLVSQGAPQLGANGQVYRTQLPWGNEGGDAAFANGGGAVGGNSGGGGPAVPAGGSRRPDGRILDASGRTIYTPPAGSGGGGKTKKPAGGGATKAGPATVAPSINYQDPKSVFGAVAQRGLDAGNTATQGQARTAIGNILGTAGGGGPEATGFEGYNPVLADLTGRLQGNADRSNARDLIEAFLNENNRGGNGGAVPGSVGTGSAGGRGSSSGYTRGPNGALIAPPAGSSNGAGVPDTMAVDSYFGDQTRRIMDEQANESELEALISSMNEDTQKGMFRDLAQLDAAAQGSGRFGGDMWKGMNSDAREEALQEMTKTAAGVRIGDRDARRNARLAALAGVNQRDQSLLGANVSREGIAAGERASSAASNASYAASQDQLGLARRGQDLSAISALLGNEEFNLNQLGQVGGQLSGDRLGALGLVPGLEGIGLQGLQTALGAGGGLTDLRGQDVQRQIANQSANLQRQGLNQNAAMWNAGQQQQLVNNYLGTLQGIGGMGGTSTGTGISSAPYGGPSPGAAGVMAGLGAGLSAYGTFNQYRQPTYGAAPPGMVSSH